VDAPSLGSSPPLTDPGVLAGLGALGVLVAVDASTGVQLTGAYAAGAIVASMLTVGRRTLLVGLACLAAALLGGTWHGNLGSREWAVRAVMCAVLAALALVSAAFRDAREARLRRMTVIAETAQQAVLRAMPTAVGAVGFAARYVSASAEALVGGDLYEVAATPYGVRVIVGDVRGKGLEAVRTAASVLGAFRQGAFVEPDPASLAREIDDVVARLVDDEEFVTAVIAEFREGEVTIANCGHHPPLLVGERSALLLDAAEPALPLGLGAAPVLQRHRWPAGARLLFYTDGLVEARDPGGEFFPLEEHARTLVGGPLAESLDGLVQHLLDFSGRRMEDDLALVLAENRSVPG
jgi:serine phosphatase RsbU (regulator of sigma subunit)